MKQKVYKLSSVLIILLLNLFIGSTIFAQIETKTKRVGVEKSINKKPASINKRQMQLKVNTAATLGTETPSPTPPYSVGDFIEGGIVFYVDNTGEHGLVCAKTDQSSNAPWSKGVFIVIGANEEGLYKGMDNTIVAVERETSPTTAANVCYNLELSEGGIIYDDWYLPSKDELDLISKNYAVINTTATANGGSDFNPSLYWSSTEADGANAWSQFCYDLNSNKHSIHKETQTLVRAVRRF